ncbi:MAG: hypothetical protein NTY53_06135 [Kiritimatiellaeota bacterium]|nr:hypothetical protein [Kiritimatiellota bacterium]
MACHHHTLSRLALALACVTAGMVSGCGRGAREAPPAQQVQDAVANSLPAHFTLLKLDLEPIATGPENAKFNFKATVELAEDLFAVEREVDGPTRVTLLKQTQPGGTKLLLYGHLVAHRLIDQWTLEPPQFQKDFRSLGKPRSVFGKHAYPAGSPEANEALRKQAAETEQLQQLQQSVAEQQERTQKARAENQAREEQERKARLEKARLAFEEQNRKVNEHHQQTEAQWAQADAAARQQLLAATAPGTRYLGPRIGVNASTQRLALVFLEQQGTRLRAEASNPDGQTEKRTISGDLRFNAQPASNGAVAYTIVMHGLPSNKVNPERNSIYERTIDLKLHLLGQGLDGVADAGFGDVFPLHLQRSAGATAK